MKTTNSKDSVKVNQILPIMQEHFGTTMNLARIKLMAYVIHALICCNRPGEAVTTYKDKWQIETLFKAIKSSGFNIEDTRMRELERIQRLVAVVSVALVWAYMVSDHKDINVKKIRILKHGHRVKSIVKYGLEEISDVLNRPMKKSKFDIFQFLSCS